MDIVLVCLSGRSGCEGPNARSGLPHPVFVMKLPVRYLRTGTRRQVVGSGFWHEGQVPAAGTLTDAAPVHTLMRPHCPKRHNVVASVLPVYR